MWPFSVSQKRRTRRVKGSFGKARKQGIEEIEDDLLLLLPKPRIPLSLLLSNLLQKPSKYSLFHPSLISYSKPKAQTQPSSRKMARPSRTLSASLSPGCSPPAEHAHVAGQGRVLYPFLLALNILLICLFYFGIWRFFCKKDQRIGDTNASNGTSSSTPSSPGPYSRNGRLDSRFLSSLPIFVYAIGGEEKMECAVCLMEFKEGENGRLLPRCNHRFHTACVDMWFRSHTTCPLCRASVESSAHQDSGAAVWSFAFSTPPATNCTFPLSSFRPGIVP